MVLQNPLLKWALGIGVVVIIFVVAFFGMNVPVQEVSGLPDLVNIHLPEGRAFELYTVAEHAMYHIEFATRERQNKTLNVIQVFSEDALLHGQILSKEAMVRNGKDGTVAVGHNYSFAVLKAFFEKAKERDVSLPRETRQLRKRLERLGVFEREGGVIATAQDVPDRDKVLAHEYNHGVYFSEKAYRSGVKKIWKGLSTKAQNIVRAILLQYNYNVNDEDLVIREFAALFREREFVAGLGSSEKQSLFAAQQRLVALEE